VTSFSFATPQQTFMNLHLFPLFWILFWPGKDSHSTSHMPSCSRLFEAKTTYFYLILIISVHAKVPGVVSLFYKHTLLFDK